MFSRWIVTNTACVRRTLHCHKTRITCEDKLVICGQYQPRLFSGTCSVVARYNEEGQENASVQLCHHPPVLFAGKIGRLSHCVRGNEMKVLVICNMLG
jgi:hypothetical protein